MATGAARPAAPKLLNALNDLATESKAALTLEPIKCSPQQEEGQETSDKNIEAVTKNQNDEMIIMFESEKKQRSPKGLQAMQGSRTNSTKDGTTESF